MTHREHDPKTTPETDIADRNVDRLLRHSLNPPRINEGAVESVAKSLQEFGWRQPIVVDSEGVIVCGHTRYKASQVQRARTPDEAG